jgi:small subunit ribosomal protein S20
LNNKSVYAIIVGLSRLRGLEILFLYSWRFKLANIQSAKKRIRQTATRTKHNRVYRSAARTHIKRTRQLIADGNLDEAEASALMAYKTLDKAARRRIIHPRNAARRKGRLMASLAKARTEAAG